MKNFCIAFTLLLLTNLTFAKIVPPKPVAPIVHNGIEYSAPHENMGCVYAKDSKTKNLLWWKQIYSVKFDILLERDVQFVFITSLKIKDDHLIITSEKGTYKLHLYTLKVSSGPQMVQHSSKIPVEKLLGHWVREHENEVNPRYQCYIAQGSKKLAPSRFRMQYIFAKNGKCQYYKLAANDAHKMVSATWKKQQGTIFVYQNKKLVKVLEIAMHSDKKLILIPLK